MAVARIKIYKRQYSTENGRQKELAPKLHYKTWCEISSLYGNELYQALDIRLENTIVFEVRYCKAIKQIQQHLKEYFVEYEGERYNIYAADYRRNDRQYVQLKANQFS